MSFYRVSLNDLKTLKTRIFTGNSIDLIQQIFLKSLQEGPEQYIYHSKHIDLTKKKKQTQMRPSTQQAQGIADAVLTTHRRKPSMATTLEHTRLGTHTPPCSGWIWLRIKFIEAKLWMGQLHVFEVIFVKGHFPFPAKPLTENISVVWFCEGDLTAAWHPTDQSPGLIQLIWLVRCMAPSSLTRPSQSCQLHWRGQHSANTGGPVFLWSRVPLLVVLPWQNLQMSSQLKVEIRNEKKQTISPLCLCTRA